VHCTLSRYRAKVNLRGRWALGHGSNDTENYWATEAGQHLVETPVFNPFLNEHPDTTGWIWHREGALCLYHEVLVNPINREPGGWDKYTEKLPDNDLAFHARHAYWKRMQIAQPAIFEITFQCSITKEEIELHDDTGVKIGVLVGAFQDHWLECPNCPIWMGEVVPGSLLTVRMRTIDA
jgi:hypothetical protein